MRWEAVYSNGVVVHERDGHRYADLNHDGLVALRLVDEKGVIGETEHAEGRTLFYRIRTFNLGLHNECKVAILGYKTPSHVSFTVYFPDGTKKQFQEWNTSPWTAEPSWLPNERP